MDADPPPAMRDLLLPDFANPMIPPTAKKHHKNKVPFNNHNDNVPEVEATCKMELPEMVESQAFNGKQSISCSQNFKIISPVSAAFGHRNPKHQTLRHGIPDRKGKPRVCKM